MNHTRPHAEFGDEFIRFWSKRSTSSEVENHFLSGRTDGRKRRDSASEHIAMNR